MNVKYRKTPEENTQINDFEVKSEENILTVLQQLETDEEEFAVLDDGEKNFIQTSGGKLEYRDGEKQYRVADAPVSNEKIREAFLSYYRRDRGERRREEDGASVTNFL